MNDEEQCKIAIKYLGIPGRIVSMSKSGYRREYPDNEVYFNANMLTKSNGKIWFGDLDITVSKSDLEKISKELNEKIYILTEMDCRFDTADLPIEKLLLRAIKVI